MSRRGQESKQNKKQWTVEQINLLKSMEKDLRLKNWKMISKIFYKNRLKRSQQEIRNKWVNSLDPNINHEPWTYEELQTLYQQYDKKCSQWSIIQKSLPNRTQIKIKNHFYGVLRNVVRFTMKYFKTAVGKETEYSNRINPNTLKSLYCGEDEFQFVGSQIKTAIKKMNYKFNRSKMLKIIQKNQQTFSTINFLIVNLFVQPKNPILRVNNGEGQENLHYQIQDQHQQQIMIQYYKYQLIQDRLEEPNPTQTSNPSNFINLLFVNNWHYQSSQLCPTYLLFPNIGFS